MGDEKASVVECVPKALQEAVPSAAMPSAEGLPRGAPKTGGDDTEVIMNFDALIVSMAKTSSPSPSHWRAFQAQLVYAINNVVFGDCLIGATAGAAKLGCSVITAKGPVRIIQTPAVPWRRQQGVSA